MLRVIPDPSVTGAPTVIVKMEYHLLFGLIVLRAKLTVLYRDEKVDICGPGGFKSYGPGSLQTGVPSKKGVQTMDRGSGYRLRWLKKIRKTNPVLFY